MLVQVCGNLQLTRVHFIQHLLTFLPKGRVFAGVNYQVQLMCHNCCTNMPFIDQTDKDLTRTFVILYIITIICAVHLFSDDIFIFYLQNFHILFCRLFLVSSHFVTDIEILMCTFLCRRQFLLMIGCRHGIFFFFFEKNLF
jgi:uncharacterized protein (DUF983 family)